MNEYQKRVREEGLIARAMDIKFREIANRKKVGGQQRQEQAGDQDLKLIVDQDADIEEGDRHE